MCEQPRIVLGDFERYQLGELELNLARVSEILKICGDWLEWYRKEELGEEE